MKRRDTKVSFERTVLASLAAVTVMVCGALGGVSLLGGTVVLVGMYTAFSIVVAGCVRALAIELTEPTTTSRPAGTRP